MSETAAQIEPPSAHPLARLFDPGTVRARCAASERAVANNVSSHFTLDKSHLPAAADRVAALTLRRYPDLHIPHPSRWRHFEAGGVDRKSHLDKLLGDVPPSSRAHAMMEYRKALDLQPKNAAARQALDELRAAPPKGDKASEDSVLKRIFGR